MVEEYTPTEVLSIDKENNVLIHWYPNATNNSRGLITPDGVTCSTSGTTGILSVTRDSVLDTNSTNAVQNKPVAEAINEINNLLSPYVTSGGTLSFPAGGTLDTAFSLSSNSTNAVQAQALASFLSSELAGYATLSGTETLTNKTINLANNTVTGLSTVATSGSYTDLTNKPTIPDAQVQSNWTETDSTVKSYIQNKPNLATVATSGDYTDLINTPTIPTVPTTLSSFTDDLGSSPTHTHSQYVTSSALSTYASKYPSITTLSTSGTVTLTDGSVNRVVPTGALTLNPPYNPNDERDAWAGTAGDNNLHKIIVFLEYTSTAETNAYTIKLTNDSSGGLDTPNPIYFYTDTEYTAIKKAGVYKIEYNYVYMNSTGRWMCRISKVSSTSTTTTSLDACQSNFGKQAITTLSSGTVALSENCTIYKYTPSGATTFTFNTSNLNISSAVAYTFELYVIMNNVYTLTFPGTLTWQGGSAPDMSSAGKYYFAFRTVDGGSTWVGNLQGTW